MNGGAVLLVRSLHACLLAIAYFAVALDYLCVGHVVSMRLVGNIVNALEAISLGWCELGRVRRYFGGWLLPLNTQTGLPEIFIQKFHDH